MILPLLPEITVIVTVLTVAGIVTIVGIDRLWEFRTEAFERFKYVLPYVLLLGVVLTANSLLRDIGPSLSWIVGWQITGSIEAIEGEFVAALQGYSHPMADVYFSYIYIYGYIFLLAFPVVAYFVLSDDRPVREVTLAYALNYGLGVICYMLFIAYGPRNVMPELVDQILYLHWPESQLLTTEVNANVNVFPSLHTSLAVTAALLAYRTRDEYPSWLPIASFLALSVVVSTMYLGIHWLTDVVAGFVLAFVSVGGAMWLTSPVRQNGPLAALGRRLRQPIDSLVESTHERAQRLRERGLPRSR